MFNDIKLAFLFFSSSVLCFKMCQNEKVKIIFSQIFANTKTSLIMNIHIS